MLARSRHTVYSSMQKVCDSVRNRIRLACIWHFHIIDYNLAQLSTTENLTSLELLIVVKVTANAFAHLAVKICLCLLNACSAS